MSLTFANIHDPTRPPDYTGDNQDPWQLNAIIISPVRRIAVINGTSVKIGDTIYGKKVIAIESGSVTLQDEDGNITLNLVEKSVKQLIRH